MANSRREIAYFAVVTRCVLYIYQCAVDHILPDWYDPDNFNPPLPNLNQSTVTDSLVQHAFGGFYAWDSSHILIVAQYGYVFEKSLAFQSFYPFLVRIISHYFLSFLNLSLSQHYCFLLSSLFLNFICFIAAADRLYCLTRNLFKSELIACITSILFCLNPSNAHMLAPYTETLFALLTFHGLYCLTVLKQDLQASVIFGLSAITRSNGVFNFGFIIYSLLWPRLRQFIKFPTSNIFPLIRDLIRLLGNFLLFISPFVLHSMHVYTNFCLSEKSPEDFPPHLVEYSRSQPRGECPLPCDGRSPWCQYRVPLSYSYIQSHYWNVGFLKYWTFQKIPNFLLAIPVLTLTFSALQYYYGLNRNYCRKIGLCDFEKKKEDWFAGENVFVYVVHIAALTVTALPFIHVEVLTRFLFASGPLLYWYAAHLILPSDWMKMNDVIPLKFIGENLDKSVLKYFIGYTLVGTAAFVNGLPWT